MLRKPKVLKLNAKLRKTAIRDLNFRCGKLGDQIFPEDKKKRKKGKKKEPRAPRFMDNLLLVLGYLKKVY